MGAVAAVIFFIYLLVISLIGIILSIVGLIIFSKLAKKGKKFAKQLKIISIVFLILSALSSLIPTGFFTTIIMMNTLPPEDYVETEIVIEENGYQDTCFTANGVVYEVLDIEVFDDAKINNPIFSYKTSGFLNGSQCGNYYAIENPNNYDLVSDQFGRLFAPIDQKTKILNHYLNEENNELYYYNYPDTTIKIEESISNKLAEVFKNTTNYDKTSYLENIDFIDIYVLSNDELIYIESYQLVVENDTLYYISNCYDVDDNYLYELVLLNEEIYSYFKENIL